ncbi:MAG TPA: hypothetical protein VGJ22_03725 [Anaerolineales bacterium]|jgi:hypothetical protein
MQYWRHPSSLISAYCLLAGIGVLLLVPALLGPPSGGQGNVLFGYSAAQLALAGVIAALAGAFFWIAFKARKDRGWAERLWRQISRDKKILNGIVLGSALVFALGWIACFTPAYRVGEDLSGYFVRLRPIAIWLTAISAITFCISVVARYGWHPDEFMASLKASRQVLRAGALALAILLMLLGLVLWTGIGLRVREDYWYATGVPVLGLQVLFALTLGCLALWWEKHSRPDDRTAFRLDLAICAALWLATAYVWANEPLRSSFFLPGPSRPNHAYYPYSDGATFDISSQFALIGQGMSNQQSLDRAIYPIFLVLMHAIGGQDYPRLMALQAMSYACFPVIVYLLGQQLHSRAAGLAAGSLISLRGVNAIISSAWIDSAGPKMPLTDFPTAIGVALISLLIVLWMKHPVRNWKHALWAGGVSGLTVMLRTNALLLVPFIVLYALTAYPSQIKKWFITSSLLVAAMFVTTLAWDLRNHSVGSPMFSLYFGRIQSVLQTRYPPWRGPIPSPTATPSGAAPGPNSLAPDRMLRSGFDYSFRIETQELSKACRSSIACSIANNYVHNLVTSVLVLPTSPTLHDLRHTVKDAAPYWQQGWVGQNFGALAGFFLLLNLALIALGIGAGWGRVRHAALVPLLSFFVYAASNGLARTSGGRYIVPIDWVVCLYFVFGALELIYLAAPLFGVHARVEPAAQPRAQSSTSPSARRSIAHAAFILAALFAIGSLLPVAERLYPPRYQIESDDQIVARLEASGLLVQAGVDGQALRSFLGDPQAKILTGRALYPRYYSMGGGEMPNDYPYAILDFPRLVLSVIGPVPAPKAYDAHGVILPIDKVNSFPHAADVVVLGCQEERYLDALMVFVVGEQNIALVRSPAASLSCPLPQPVCDNNHRCR